MTVYKDTLKQMYNAQPGATWTTTTSYAAPTAGAVVRSIHISNGNSTTKYVSIIVESGTSSTPSATGSKHIYWQTPVGGNSVHDMSCNIFLASGDYLRFYAEATGVTITVSGVELEEAVV